MEGALDYAPVDFGLDPDEEERQRKFGGYAPVAPVPAAASPAPASPPLDLSARSLEHSLVAPIADVRQPRPEWKDYAPVPPAEPHGWSKFGHAIASLEPGLNEYFNVRPQREFQNKEAAAKEAYTAATGEYEAPGKEAEQAATIEEKEANAYKAMHPPGEWEPVTGWQGPNNEPMEHNKATGIYRPAPGGEGAKLVKQPGETGNDFERYYAQKVKEGLPDSADNRAATYATWVKNEPQYAAAQAQRDVANNTRNDARSDRSYQFHAGEINKLAAPIEQRAERISRLEDTLNQNSPQADALIAPELLTVMAGGQGSGLRMNEAEISRIVGGRDKWESIKSALQSWQLDPTKPFAFQPEQRKEIRDLFATIRDRVNQKLQIVKEGRAELVESDDPKEHRRIAAQLQQRLDQVDTGGAKKQAYQRDGKWYDAASNEEIKTK